MRSLQFTSLIFRIGLEVANIAALFLLLAAIILYFAAPSKLASYILLIGLNPAGGTGSVLLSLIAFYIFVSGTLAIILDIRENAKQANTNSEQIVELLRSISMKITNYESRSARQISDDEKTEASSRYESIYQNMKSAQKQKTQSSRPSIYQQNADPNKK